MSLRDYTVVWPEPGQALRLRFVEHGYLGYDKQFLRIKAFGVHRFPNHINLPCEALSNGHAPDPSKCRGCYYSKLVMNSSWGSFKPVAQGDSDNDHIHLDALITCVQRNSVTNPSYSYDAARMNRVLIMPYWMYHNQLAADPQLPKYFDQSAKGCDAVLRYNKKDGLTISPITGQFFNDHILSHVNSMVCDRFFYSAKKLHEFNLKNWSHHNSQAVAYVERVLARRGSGRTTSTIVDVPAKTVEVA